MKVYVLIEMFQGVVNNVSVFPDKQQRDAAYIEAIKEEFQDEADYKDQLEHGMPKYEFTRFNCPMEEREKYTPDVDIEFEEDEVE